MFFCFQLLMSETESRFLLLSMIVMPHNRSKKLHYKTQDKLKPEYMQDIFDRASFLMTNRSWINSCNSSSKYGTKSLRSLGSHI